MTIAALAMALPPFAIDARTDPAEAPLSFADVLAAMRAPARTGGDAALDQASPVSSTGTMGDDNHPGDGRSPVATGPMPGLGPRRSIDTDLGDRASDSAPDAPATAAPLPVQQPATAAGASDPPSGRARPSIHPPARSPADMLAALDIPGQTRGDEEEDAPILPARAAVFNERGLFRSVAATGSPNAMPVDRQLHVAQAMQPNVDAAAREPAVSIPLAEPEPIPLLTPSSRAAFGIHLPEQSPADRLAPPLTPGRARADVGVAMPITVAAAAGERSPGGGSGDHAQTAVASLRSAAPRAPLPAYAFTAASPPATRTTERAAIARPNRSPAPDPRRDDPVAQAQLTLTPTADGLHVLAAVTRSDRDERTRLRDRIAGLLSRHGFALADLRLGGAALPAPKDR